MKTTTVNGIIYELKDGVIEVFIAGEERTKMGEIILKDEEMWNSILNGADPIKEGWDDGNGNTLNKYGWGDDEMFEWGYPSTKTINGITYEFLEYEIIKAYNEDGKYLGMIAINDLTEWFDILLGADPIKEGWEDGVGNTVTLDGWGDALEEE